MKYLLLRAGVLIICVLLHFQDYCEGNKIVTNIFKTFSMGSKRNKATVKFDESENADTDYCIFENHCYWTPCYSFPCLNGGTCIDKTEAGKKQEQYSCKCAIGFTGDNCEHQIRPCTKKEALRSCTQNMWTKESRQTCHEEDKVPYCQNDGKCFIKTMGKEKETHCQCLDGFEGERCELFDKDCSSNPCKNGGECQKGSNSKDGSPSPPYSCKCAPEYVGVHCQEKKYQSYINFPRIHFAGRFQADPSTVNNYKHNFDTLHFTAYNAMMNNKGGNGGWNPTGSGNWRVINATVTSVCIKDGECTDQKGDGIVGTKLKDGQMRASGKLVDLDTDMQMASEIWGWSIEIENFLRGDFQRVSFNYMWSKNQELISMAQMGAKYQSILTNVTLGPLVSRSPMAKEFSNAMGVNQELSIALKIDMYDYNSESINFTYGRVVGTIGIQGRESPPYFSVGRMLKPLNDPQDNDDHYKYYFAPFAVDNGGERVHLDLGNSLAIDGQGEFLQKYQKLAFATVPLEDVGRPTCYKYNFSYFQDLEPIDTDSYLRNSGIIDFSVSSEMDLSNKRAVILQLDNTGKCHEVVLAEDKNGISLQPKTRWLFRTEVNNTVTVELLVTQFGRIPTESPLEVHIEDRKGAKPELNYSQGPLNFKDGIYKFCITPDQDPDHIRKYVDGQVYQLQYGRREDIKDLVANSNIAQVSAIHILVWDVFTKPTKTNWYEDIQPIFQQYADLYPVMKMNFFDLGNYYDVVNSKDAILRTMKLDPRDPNFMPVTRDLSPNKTEMITTWLEQDIPYLGTGKDFRINVKTLRYLLQIALQLEHATIPPYLNGFFSIKSGQNQEVKEILYNIFKEEMYHLAQVSNLLNAFGGHPDVLDQHFVLPYPSYLPGGVNPGVKISINKVSYQQIHDVYMEIEKPSNETEEFGMAKVIDLLENISAGNSLSEALEFWGNRSSHVESVNHNTIGELYMAIICVIDTFGKQQINDLIEKSRTTPQLKYGPVIEVTNFATAIKAINSIVEQGEGASGCNPLYSEKNKSISHYFQFASIIRKRLVKSYPYNATGPKQEEQKEPSKFHLYKEQKCNGSYDYVGKTIPFYEGGVWPLVNDPKMSKYTNPRAINLAQSFKETYHNLLRTLQSIFNGEVHRFNDTFGLMKALVIIANRLVQTPIHENGDPEIGPNAAPIYN